MTVVSETSGTRRLLIDALSNLAADPDTQLARLRARGPWSLDDLALDHNHAAGAALRARILTPAQSAAVQELDTYLDKISGHDHAQLWTETALRSAQEWSAIRELARRALVELQQTGDGSLPK